MWAKESNTLFRDVGEFQEADHLEADPVSKFTYGAGNL